MWLPHKELDCQGFKHVNDDYYVFALHDYKYIKMVRADTGEARAADAETEAPDSSFTLTAEYVSEKWDSQHHAFQRLI